MPGYELIDKSEEKEVQKVFKNGGVLFRHSFDALRNKKYFVRDFEKKFQKKFNAPYALAVSSGTSAIRVALSTLNLKPGDEVITQSFTFVATVEAIIESRASPVCCEVDETLNMDSCDLLKKINKKTSQELSESDKNVIEKMINKLSVKEITNFINQNRDVSKKEIYNYCLKLKNEN